MVKDGEDWHWLQTTNSENLGYTFQDLQTATQLLLNIDTANLNI